MQQSDLTAFLVCAAFCVILWMLADRADRVKSTKWKLLWLIPAAGAFLIPKYGPDLSLLPLYLGAVIAALGFFTENKRNRKMISAAGAVCILLSIPACKWNPRYRAKDYFGDFEQLYAGMREHYVLTEHKGIDWDALYTKYQPQFAEIDRTQDAGANSLAWAAFCGEFHDGHVGYIARQEDTAEDVSAAFRKALGNDYGLSVMRCTDGSFAAVNTDPRLAASGIHNGTVITKWDGKSPDAVSKTSPAYGLRAAVADPENEELYINLDSYPDIDNEIFWSGVLAAGIGGDSVTVTYLDDAGTEQTAVLPRLGDYFARICGTLQTINQGVNAGNLEWKKLNDTTACLRIKGMSYDSKTYEQEEDGYNEMKDEIRAAILRYQQQGVQDVIIDLRSNTGGSPHMVSGVVSMFAPKGTHYNNTTCLWDDRHHCWATDDTGRYIPKDDINFEGEQLLGDGRVIVLVNSETVSAGDDMVKVMEDMENVTILGFTGPNGSCQAVNYLAGDCGIVSFSSCATLERDGSIFIDSGIDRQSTDGDAVQIVPFDRAAIHALFDEHEDYLLKQALAELEK